MRLLALATLKYSPGFLRILGYEEPENGMHPTLLDHSVGMLRDIAKAGTQVIVTTHSPYLLNYCMQHADDDDIKPKLLLVIRDPRTGNTRIVPPNPDKLRHAQEQGMGAGDLWGMLVDENELT